MDKSKAAPLTDKIDNQYLNKIYLEVTEELCKLHTQNTELQTEVQRLKEIIDELENDDLPNVRAWVSLTNEEKQDIKGRWVCGEFESFDDCLAVFEAALRSKNNG